MAANIAKSFGVLYSADNFLTVSNWNVCRSGAFSKIEESASENRKKSARDHGQKKSLEEKKIKLPTHAFIVGEGIPPVVPSSDPACDHFDFSFSGLRPVRINPDVVSREGEGIFLVVGVERGEPETPKLVRHAKEKKFPKN
jgi:hypothetical protein